MRGGQEAQALGALRAAQNDPREYEGTLIFDKLGFAVSGLHTEDVENKAVSAFVVNHWGDVTRLPFANLGS